MNDDALDSTRGLTRGQFARVAASTIAASAGVAAYARTATARAATMHARAALAAGGTLNLYTWPNYCAQENIKDFKAKTGISLHVSTLESNDSLFAKLNSPAGRTMTS